MAQKREEIKFRESVKKMTVDEIGVELKTLRDRLFTLRSQAVTEKVENTADFGVVKRNIARLLTEQNARLVSGSGAARTPHAAPKKVARAPKAAKAPVKKTAKSGSPSAKSRPSARTKTTKTAKAAK